LWITGHVPTNELRDFASPASASKLEPLCEDAVQVALLVDGLDLCAIAHNVRVTVGEDDDVAGTERKPVVIFYSGKPLPLRNKVIDDDVTAARREVGRQD
jgi:hypothetical protein